ncbi:LysM peptidoglycan-binding domain-containing protein [Bacillus solitudinis]|uniref:LysM peptidoglycan-binding domain-containing protein n=1 Tax=Bacillus solitudinis TaxID=2014074 RepID=UPI000C24D2AD|nr:LysM peptidoglycan-binding domain-containing protein [Bacillus solitudinis]
MRKRTLIFIPVFAVGLAVWGNDLSPKAESVLEGDDNLWSIAQKYTNVTVEDIIGINDQLNNLQIGTEVTINQVTHTIEPGDTIWSLAQEYESTTVEEILKLNDLLNPYNLQVGNEITISQVTHTVQPDETLWSIAQEYDGINIEDILNLNIVSNANNLQIGQEISLGNITHTIRPGDTLWSLSEKYEGVTLKNIVNLNPGLNPYNLQIGHVIGLGKVTHIVQPGDTLWSIAQEYNGLSVEEILNLNADLNSFNLQIENEVDNEDENIVDGALNHSTARNVMTEFKKSFMDLADNSKKDGEITNLDSKEELVSYFTAIMSEELATWFADTYFREENNILYIKAMDAPTWLQTDQPFTLEKVNDTEYKVIQERNNALIGHVNMIYILSLKDGEWIVKNIEREEIDNS